MSVFDQHLKVIGRKICINNEDRGPVNKDFDRILLHLLTAMKSVDPVFNKICKGPSRHGCYPTNVRTGHSNEFDVIIKLSFPYMSRLEVNPDTKRPGFVNIGMSDTMDMLADNPHHSDVFDRLLYWIEPDQNENLIGYQVQLWFSKLIRKGLASFGKQLTDSITGDRYTMKYSKRAMAHTVYARNLSRPFADISIDLVPGIMFRRPDWINIHSIDRKFRYKCETWFALPKISLEGPKESRKIAFIICNPKIEHDMMLGNSNIKLVYRLLKALRNEYEIDGMKSYFLTTAFLWELEVRKRTFWNKPISTLLLHMLDVLADCFNNEDMPFFWNPDLNLINILSPDKIDDHRGKLKTAFEVLSTYGRQEKLTLKRVWSHFSDY